MRRTNKNSSTKKSLDSQSLIDTSLALAQAGSQIERRDWQTQLKTLIQKQLKLNHQETLEAALEHLLEIDQDAYNHLLEAVESNSETIQLEVNGQRHQGLLLTIPVLAWSRFSISAGHANSKIIEDIRAQFSQLILIENLPLIIAPTLYSIDLLPQTYGETQALLTHLIQHLLKGERASQLTSADETVPFVADIRFLIAAALIPDDAKIFRWQQPHAIKIKNEILQQWQNQVTPHMNKLLPGCGIELALPDAYYATCRQADKAIRPISIRAAVNYLTHVLDVSPNELQVIIGGFSEQEVLNERLDEYRISFALCQSDEILYGTIWPLYGLEDEETILEEKNLTLEEADQTTEKVANKAHKAGRELIAGFTEELSSGLTSLETIVALLHETGITQIKQHEGLFSMESCEDCGASLFLDSAGELVHPELPEEVIQGSGHFH